MPDAVDLLKRDLIAVAELQHIDVDLFGRRGWGKRVDDLRVDVLLQSHRVVEGPHESLELCEGGKAEMIGGVYEGVDHG